jgi:hypothetical protein
MHLFTGMSTTDYQDVLRAVGKFADERGWRYLRFQEMDDGLLLQGMEMREHGHLGVRHVSHVFTDEDIREILVAAYRRRQGGARASRNDLRQQAAG